MSYIVSPQAASVGPTSVSRIFSSVDWTEFDALFAMHCSSEDAELKALPSDDAELEERKSQYKNVSYCAVVCAHVALCTVLCCRSARVLVRVAVRLPPSSD